jgi:site-specific DNA-methyltransferase (adenine-specific)
MPKARSSRADREQEPEAPPAPPRPTRPDQAGTLEFDRLYAGDCLGLFPRVASGSIDLVFADPPFNIGYDYDIYDDRREAETYLDWTRSWGREVVRALKPDGTFWLAIGDEYAAELKVLFHRELGLSLRSWVIWYYTFGVHCTRKFSRSHAHLFYFVKDPKRFTFNDQSIRVPSARQLVYFDSRANPEGRLPDDTWILHGCSNPGETVLDPFGGSGTTLTVAKKLGRRFLGFELSPDYAAAIETRLAATRVGQSLEGGAEPLAGGKGRGSRTKSQ